MTPKCQIAFVISTMNTKKKTNDSLSQVIFSLNYLSTDISFSLAIDPQKGLSIREKKVLTKIHKDKTTYESDSLTSCSV